jgi:hypothetical protein
MKPLSCIALQGTLSLHNFIVGILAEDIHANIFVCRLYCCGVFVLGILTSYYLVRLRTVEDIRGTGNGSAGARNVG